MVDFNDEMIEPDPLYPIRMRKGKDGLEFEGFRPYGRKDRLNDWGAVVMITAFLVFGWVIFGRAFLWIVEQDVLPPLNLGESALVPARGLALGVVLVAGLVWTVVLGGFLVSHIRWAGLRTSEEQIDVWTISLNADGWSGWLHDGSERCPWRQWPWDGQIVFEIDQRGQVVAHYDCGDRRELTTPLPREAATWLCETLNRIEAQRSELV